MFLGLVHRTDIYHEIMYLSASDATQHYNQNTLWDLLQAFWRPRFNFSSSLCLHDVVASTLAVSPVSAFPSTNIRSTSSAIFLNSGAVEVFWYRSNN